MRTVLMLVAVLGLGGCNTFNKRMDTWKGHSIDEVTQRLGAPNGTVDRTDGGKTYTFTRSAGYTSRATSSFIGEPTGAVETVENYCTLHFTTDNIGIIQTWSAEGRACR